jgi:hypothetical protein
MSQSTNDVYPTALRLTLSQKMDGLMLEMESLCQALALKGTEFANVTKMGRTQLWLLNQHDEQVQADSPRQCQRQNGLRFCHKRDSEKECTAAQVKWIAQPAVWAMRYQAMGLLIGILAQSDEQAVIFSLIPMFVFSGLGGARMPLEVTGATFQAIGHVSPIAWAMDGFKNITTRSLGMNSVLLPSSTLIGYAVLFFILAAWRFWA